MMELIYLPDADDEGLSLIEALNYLEEQEEDQQQQQQQRKEEEQIQN